MQSPGSDGGSPGLGWEGIGAGVWGGLGHPGYHSVLSGLPGSHPWTMAPPPGSTPSRTGGFLGTTSPGPMAELYGAANQDSGVSSYISAASPAPSTGFGHSLGVSGQALRASTSPLLHARRCLKLLEGAALSILGRGGRGLREGDKKKVSTRTRGCPVISCTLDTVQWPQDAVQMQCHLLSVDRVQLRSVPVLARNWLYTGLQAPPCTRVDLYSVSRSVSGKPVPARRTCVSP